MAGIINRKNIITIILSFMVVIIGFSYWRCQQTPDDLIELDAVLEESKSEYQSERGFGNDRLDIYSFSMKKPDAEISMREFDDRLEERYDGYIGVLDSENDGKNSEVKRLKEDMESVKTAKDTTYLFVRCGFGGGTEKLYFYSSSLNKGYCIIFVI